jgi:hypothetical protein
MIGVLFDTVNSASSEPEHADNADRAKTKRANITATQTGPRREKESMPF